ncbi:hypothetical protein GQ600_13905 [Phytophthora cactorum]|nr:hypothetical protein GQ600_13905 [Phytophthora cactorum]
MATDAHHSTTANDSTWSVTYYEQERERKRRSERSVSSDRPASIGLVSPSGANSRAPLMMLLVFIFTDYVTTGTFLIEATAISPLVRWICHVWRLYAVHIE